MTDNSTRRADPVSLGTEEGETTDLHAYWRAIVRRRWLVLPFFIAAVVVTTGITLRQTKIYDATCTIIIDLSAPKVLDKESVQDVMETGTGGYWFSREYYETQYRVITSRAVGQRVVDRMQLAGNQKFLTSGPGQSSSPREMSGVSRDPVTILLRGLKVEPVKDSRVVRIRYEDSDPQIAAQIANAVADAYIEENLAVRTVTTQNASIWLEKQLTDLESKMDQSGLALFDFKKAHDIVATSWEDRQSMVSQRLTAFNDALTKVQVRKAELHARNDAIEAAAKAINQGRSEIEALQPVVSSQAIQQLKIRYLEAAAECADMRIRYLEDHPKTQACTKKLSLAGQGLKDEIDLSLESARREYLEVVKTERSLQVLFNETKSDAFRLNQYERNYLELKRNYDNNSRLYELVLKRLKDTGMSGLLQVSNVRILDRARVSSTPIRPNVAQNVGVSIVLGLLGGVALAFVADFADRSITGQQQIEEQLGLTFLGVIPSIAPSKDGSPQDLFVHTQPKSAAAECLRAVRTNLLFMSPEKPLKTILVTSSGPQEGKTTTATSLAITMATSGNRVLLVDADMRRPRVHRIFGISNQAGLSSLILGEGRLSELIKATGVENLFVLPCGPVPPNPAELLHTAAFQKLVTEMAGAFDRVIIDSPPVGVVADAVVIGTHVDGTLLVLKASKTSREVARQAVRQLRDVKAPIFGAVLNNLDLQDQRYGQYSYYYRYGYYYGEEGGKISKPPDAVV